MRGSANKSALGVDAISGTGRLRETYIIDPERKLTQRDRERRWTLLRALFGKKRRGPDPVHDLCFFMAMSDPEFVKEVKEVLATYFPELSDELDLDQITAEPVAFLNRLLKRIIADLIFFRPVQKQVVGRRQNPNRNRA